MEPPRMNSEIQDDLSFIRSVLHLTSTTSKEQAMATLRNWNWNQKHYLEKHARDKVKYTLNHGVSAGSGVSNRLGANARQVGGSHYEAELQHWDIIEDYGIGYLEGCASKYVTRARKKNGLQDLDKATHYIEKLIEKSQQTESVGHAGVFDALRVSGRKPRGCAPIPAVLKFIRSNGLTDLEGAICLMIFTWETTEDLVFIRESIGVLKRETASATAASAAEVATTIAVTATGISNVPASSLAPK